MELDQETDRFCAALLSAVSEINPRLSNQITKRVNSSAKLRKDKRLRKLAKVAIFYKEHSDIYQTAVHKLSRLPEWNSPVSNPKITKFYESAYELLKLEPVPGSFESKYDYTQKPTPH